IAAASTEEKRSFVRAQGADAAIDYTVEDWRKALKAMMGGKAIDVIFDPVGGEISPVAFRTLGWRGRHLVVGFVGGKIPALPFNIALLKGSALIGVDPAQLQRWEPDLLVQLKSDIALSLENRSLEPPPTQTFHFERFHEAFESISSRQATGKVVVEMGL